MNDPDPEELFFLRPRVTADTMEENRGVHRPQDALHCGIVPPVQPVTAAN